MRLIAGLAIGLALTGCSGTPKWARMGTVAFTPSDKVFYGVGQADDAIVSRDLRMEAADNRARADLQKYFNTYTGYLMQEYDGPDGKLVERAIRTFSNGRLSGVRIAERYEKRGKIHSLARLDLDEFRRVIKNAPELSDKTRQQLLERSEKLFDQMRTEEMKEKSAR